MMTVAVSGREVEKDRSYFSVLRGGVGKPEANIIGGIALLGQHCHWVVRIQEVNITGECIIGE